MQTACPRQEPCSPLAACASPAQASLDILQRPEPALRLCPRAIHAISSGPLGACVVAQCLAHFASTARWIYDPQLDFGWGCTRSALPWCSQRQWRGKPAVEGVHCDLPGGNADGFGVKAECGSRVSLERGMSWSTSGPVSGSFPKEGWKGWFPTRVSWSLSYLHSKSCLWLPF